MNPDRHDAHIRRATAADAEALAELATATFVQAFGHEYAPQDLADFLAQRRNAVVYRQKLEESGTAVWVAAAPNGHFMGYAVAGNCRLPVRKLEPGAGELRELYVHADAQGQGLGTALLETALRWLEQEGRKPLYVSVWSRNTGAQRLYARHGFRRVGEYEFPVGRARDLEFILRRAAASG